MERGDPPIALIASSDELKSRREMFERMGQYAYAAPAMVLLIDPANAKDDYKDKPKDDEPPKKPKK